MSLTNKMHLFDLKFWFRSQLLNTVFDMKATVHLQIGAALSEI